MRALENHFNSILLILRQMLFLTAGKAFFAFITIIIITIIKIKFALTTLYDIIAII